MELYYREYGAEHAGQEIICLPGLTRNCKDFDSIARHLSGKYRVLCADPRGRGQSARDPIWRNYNLAVYAPDVRALMAHAGTRQAIFLGTSMGGLITMILAYQSPGQVKAAILNDVGPELNPVGISRILETVGRTPAVTNWEEAEAQCRASYEHALPDMPDGFWQEYVRFSYRENAQGQPERDMDPRIGDAIRSANKAAIFLRRFNRFGLFRKIKGIPLDSWEIFRGLIMPGLVIRGETSAVLSADTVKKMCDVKPDLKVATIANRGHAPLLNEPESLIAIDSFLESLD